MKKIIVVLFLITIIVFSSKNKTQEVLIPEDSIRFRIIASSNNSSDQAQKLTIKKELEKNIINNLKTTSLYDTEDSIKKSINTIRTSLNKYNIDYDIAYGDNYFPEKSYKGVIYKAGNYKSLVITLGEGLGDNWWCVLFPPLCLLESSEEDFSNVEYSWYVKDILNKFRS